MWDCTHLPFFFNFFKCAAADFLLLRESAAGKFYHTNLQGKHLDFLPCILLSAFSFFEEKCSANQQIQIRD
jgi:hypothetical protein